MPDMSCAATLGELIQELRKAHGWSQAQLAARLCAAADHDSLTREYISRWEHGAKKPGRFWLKHLAAVLEVPIEILERGDVDRRQFITSVAGTAIAPVVASDLVERGFVAALNGSGPSLDDWGQAVEIYGRDYMTAGAAEIQRRLATDLVVLQQQLDSPRMWAIAARLATLYAKTFPGADGVKAVTWYRHAARFADRSGDLETRIWVRGRAAIALGYEGAALGAADHLAQQAIGLDDRPTLGRLNAVMGRAHVAALHGDRTTALQLVDEGRRVFDHAGSDDAPSDYAVPWWRFQVFISLLAARLGDDKLALDAQDQASKNLPPTLPRFRTHLEMHKGLMLVRAGDPDGGAAYAQQALDELPPEKHSLTLRMLMDEIDPPKGH